MNSAMTWTEKQIKVAARKIAREAGKLRRAGKLEAAEALVKTAAANVDALRAAGRVV